MMSRSKRLAVRKIQRWLKRHEYMSGYGIALHKCDTEYASAICRRGFVNAKGGGCVIESWASIPLNTIRALHKAAIRQLTRNLNEERVDNGTAQNCN